MDYTFEEQISLAKEIIRKSQRSGKLLVEYKLWERLDERAKKIALGYMSCDRCFKLKKQLNHVHNMYGFFMECLECNPNGDRECNYCINVKGLGEVRYI